MLTAKMSTLLPPFSLHYPASEQQLLRRARQLLFQRSSPARVTEDMASPSKVEKANVTTSPTIPLHQKNQDDVNDTDTESDGLEDLWNDMALALEWSKEVEQPAPIEEKNVDCCHSFILKDDIGIVCKVCGLIKKSIDTIWDFQWK